MVAQIVSSPISPAPLPPDGDFSRGRFVWVLENPRLLAIPLPYKGRLGLFDVPDEMVNL